MAFFKTLVNVGLNISNDYEVPVFKTLEKYKDEHDRIIEHRHYERNKYVVIRFRSKKATASGEESKNDRIMKEVWRIMKYTQGENDRKVKMKLIMPVFVHVEAVSDDPNVDSSTLDAMKADMVDIRIMVSLPREYQGAEEGGQGLQPPAPLDSLLSFEVMDSFECFVRQFGGFASDELYESETSKLKSYLESKRIAVYGNKCLCISYDSPAKLINRRNEVVLFRK